MRKGSFTFIINNSLLHLLFCTPINIDHCFYHRLVLNPALQVPSLLVECDSNFIHRRSIHKVRKVFPGKEKVVAVDGK